MRSVFRFTLIYQGTLKPRGSSSLPDKHAIRHAIHPQLIDLWNRDPLSTIHDPEALTGPPVSGDRPSFAGSEAEHDAASRWYRQRDQQQWLQVLDGRRFCALVHTEFRAELDIRILSASNQAPLHELGDIDNRLKTLTDGLRQPQSARELEGYQPPPGGVLYTLLADDRLVTRVNVDTGRWLGREPGSDRDLVTIEVTLRAVRATHRAASLGV